MSLRGNPIGVTEQSIDRGRSIKIVLNLNGLLRRPYGTPRNDVLYKDLMKKFQAKIIPEN